VKPILIASVGFVACVAQAHATTLADRTVASPPAQIHLVGNTSSNSSSNTSSDSGSRGSSYVHRHDWSVDSDDRYGRRSVRGSTRIERYAPPHRRSYRQRRGWDDD
jgi:hypothetical protein